MSQKRKNKRFCLARTPETATSSTSKEIHEDESSEDKHDEITLLIEEDQIVCCRSLLLNSSDYFRAMLKGNFVEKDKKSVRLQGVEAKPMRDLLRILMDRSYFFKCEDIYLVLSACGMFLFEELKSWIISSIDLTISPMNCLEIWVEMEKLDITPICWKAKSLSLQAFGDILENGTITGLSLLEVRSYLGHVNLQCDNELSVFQCALNWFLHERPDDAQLQDEVVLKMLVNCISFKSASLLDLLKIRSNQHVEKYPEIAKMFDYLVDERWGTPISAREDDKSLNLARNALHSRKTRYLPKYPCLLLKTTCESDAICDVIYYDDISPSPKQLGTLEFGKLGNLIGCGIQDYRSRIFIFGGEFCIGKGSWNREVWSFDIESGKMYQKQPIPSPRRHFESCICGDYFYIVGGTGTFRVIQDNMYWYEFKSDTWSKEVPLPCSGRQIKCCSIDKRLLIFSLSEKCGYLFMQDTTSWQKLEIDDPQELIPKAFTTFCVFAYNGRVFFKGEKLIELLRLSDTLKVVNTSPLFPFHPDDIIESVINHNIIYTMYTHKGEDDDKMSLESYNLDSQTVDFIFKLQPRHSLHPVNKVQTVLKLFTYHHYELVSHKTMVNF